MNHESKPGASSSATSIPTDESLAKPSLPRRRRWARIALVSALAAQSTLLVFAFTRRPTERVITRVEQIQTTQVLTIPAAPLLVPMPVATPPTTADTRACPPPRTDAPPIVPPELPEEITGLAVSPTNAGWIAAWNANHVFVSTDAGRTFQRKLDGDGDVQSVQFDCFGRVLAARSSALGIADGTREVWHSIAGIDMSNTEDAPYDNVTVIGGGRDVVVLGKQPGEDGRARVAVSRDVGRTWTYHDLSAYTAAGETVAGVQRADGTILVGTAIPDCMSEDIGWIEIAPDGTSTTNWRQIYGLQFQFWGDTIMSSYGQRKIHASDDTSWAQYPDEAYYGIPIPAPYPVFVTDEKAARLVGTKLRDYPWKLEGDHPQMDPAGRLWSIACGRPWIARADRVSGYCADDKPAE